MKYIIAIIFLFISINVFCQDSIVLKEPVYLFLYHSKDSIFSASKFKEFDNLELSDTSLRIRSYYVYFSCDNDFHKPLDKECTIRQGLLAGGSLKNNDFEKTLKLYDHNFYITFDYVTVEDRNSKFMGYAVGLRLKIK